MRAGFERLDGRIDDTNSEMRAGFEHLDNRIDSVRDELKSDVSGLRSEMSGLRSEMKAGFAKQEKLSHDIIQTTMQYVTAQTDHHEGRANKLAKDITQIQGFLSNEFPEKYNSFGNNI